jgi:hypothetical protein
MMRFVQGMGLLVLIAIGLPAPKLPAKWENRIRRSEVLGSRLAELEEAGVQLDSLPVVPVEKLKAGEPGVVCDELEEARGYVPVCLGADAVYLTLGPYTR